MNSNDLMSLIIKNARNHTIEWMTGNNFGVSSRAQGWLSTMSDDEKILLLEVVAEAIDLSIIRILEIIYGCQNKPDNPIYLYCKGQNLASSNNEQLHDLYAIKVE